MKAWIEVIGGHLDGKEIAISKTAAIGRDEQCEIFIPADRFVSKKHALLKLWQEEGFVLEDLDSTNGTFVEERPVKEPILLTNDQIFRVGKTFLKIRYDS